MRAFICGVSGPRLTGAEAAFLARARPWGAIVFARNVETPDQLGALTADIRAALGRDGAPVLIDQEGGRVQRLRPPHWRQYPTAARLAEVFGENAADGVRAVALQSRLIADELVAAGVNVDCLPVLDVAGLRTHQVIGDRSYGADPAVVASLGRAAAGGLLAGGCLPVVKHVPGHGRAAADSHVELPTVDAGLDDLDAMDFAPFRALASMPLAMTAHVLYTALDPDEPATLSKPIIDQVIRGRIGFDGLLMSDDLSMKALSGSPGELAARALAAGCDIVLHCNGDIAEMEAVAAAVPTLQGLALARAEAAMARVEPPSPFDAAAAAAEFEALTSHRF